MKSTETSPSAHVLKKSQPEEFDLVILGGGTGSTIAAWTFAGEGKRVAVVDRKYIGGLAVHLLRRHVADGAHYLASFGLGHRHAIKILCGSRKPTKFREPEVQDFQAAAAGNKHVLRLQIAMNNILLMRRREAVRQLSRQINCFWAGIPEAVIRWRKVSPSSNSETM